MTTALEAVGLSKRYGRQWALTDCTLSIPTGRVVGLVGPNAAGKTTLLHLAVGLLEPTAGKISVLGEQPGSGPATLTRFGFLAQDSPTYARLTVGQHLQMGEWLNPAGTPRSRPAAWRSSGSIWVGARARCLAASALSSP
jgi:ABC-2 type transport system ATP-binding protein